MVENLFGGLLCVLTPLGRRYIPLSLGQRIYLLWVFRNFKVPPLQVLSPRQRRMIDALCDKARFVSLTEQYGWDAPIVGTLERRPPTENLPACDSDSLPAGAVSRLATDLPQR
jgi:hypothetical protein